MKEWTWRERNIKDGAHPARSLVEGTVRSTVRAKLEEAPNQMEALAINVGGCQIFLLPPLEW